MYNFSKQKQTQCSVESVELPKITNNLYLKADESELERIYLSLPNMYDKTIVITGGTCEISMHLATTCLKLYGNVVFLTNSPQKVHTLLEDVWKPYRSQIRIVECNLYSLESVIKVGWFLRQVLSHSGCDVLCNSACTSYSPPQLTRYRFDEQIQLNHLAHFRLTYELWPLLKFARVRHGEARVVNLTSMIGHFFNKSLMRSSLNPHKETSRIGEKLLGFSKWLSFQQSMLANQLFSNALQEKAIAKGDHDIKVVLSSVGIPKEFDRPTSVTQVSRNLVDEFMLGALKGQNSNVAAESLLLIRSCCEGGVKEGAYFSNNTRDEFTNSPHYSLLSRDAQEEQLLWESSKRATGIESSFFRA